MKRISTICLALILVIAFAVPAFAVEMESSVVSGDYIRDTYVFNVESLYYESTTDAGTINSNEITLSLPEGDSGYIEVYYEGADDLSQFNLQDYVDASVEVEVAFSIVGGVDYTVNFHVGDGTGYDRIGYASGESYDTNERIVVSGSLDLSDENRSIYPEVYVDLYSMSSNVYVKFESVKLTVIRRQIEHYEPDFTVPGGGIGEELDDAEQSAKDEISAGEDAQEEVILSAIDKLVLLGGTLRAVALLIEPFLVLSWVDTLLVLSLALGSFALLLGTTISILRRD